MGTWTLLTLAEETTWAVFKITCRRSPELAQCRGCLLGRSVWGVAVTWQSWIDVANCRACCSPSERCSDEDAQLQGRAVAAAGAGAGAGVRGHMRLQRDFRSCRRRCWYSLSSCRYPRDGQRSRSTCSRSSSARNAQANKQTSKQTA